LSCDPANPLKMPNLIPAKVLDICPSPYGHAVFVRSAEKVFVIYVDRARGAALQYAFKGEKASRPLSHEFALGMLDALDCSVKNAVIYREKDGTFFTSLGVVMKNELGCKIAEVDGRPSDVLAAALSAGAPIFVEAGLLERLPDMGEAYKKIKGD